MENDYKKNNYGCRFTYFCDNSGYWSDNIRFILATGLTKWYHGSGKFWTAITENGFLLPLILAKLLFLLAIVILIKEYFGKPTAEPPKKSN